MKLTIIIPAYNEEAYLTDCLAALQAELANPNPFSDVEILVVNNASTDGTAELASAWDEVILIQEPNKGLTKARQAGLLKASGEVVAYVDADTRMPRGWIAKVHQLFEEDQSTVCVSGPYIYYDVNSITRYLVRLYWLLLAMPSYWITHYMVVGGNFAARKSALNAIGGFDTRIPFYGEDTDIARRLTTVGKVKFTLRLPMLTSSRRFRKEGLVRVAWVYVKNFLSEVILRRPVTRAYRDIR